MSRSSDVKPESIPDEFSFYESIEAIREIPGYIERVDPKSVSFESIIGWYILSGRVMTPCQKKDCGQKHRTGYVVRFKSGDVSNIGRICGREFDPKGFLIQERAAKKKINHHYALMRVRDLISSVEDYHKVAEGINSLAKVFARDKGFFKGTLSDGDKIFWALKNMANRADYVVRHSRSLSDAEFKEAKKLYENPSRIVHEEIGSISNVSCFLVEEHKFCMSSRRSMDDLRNVDIDNSSTQQLLDVAKNIDQMVRDLDSLKKAIKEFELFKANDTNMRLLPFLL